MKYLPIIIILSFSLSAFGQQPSQQQEKSKLDSFTSRSGQLIEKQFIDIGKIDRAKVQVIIFTDMLSGAKASGVKFEFTTATRYTTDTKSGSLDTDEVDDLIKTLDYLAKRATEPAPVNYTEVIFSSRSGFSMGGYYADDKWKFFMKLERFDKDSYIWFKDGDLQVLKEVLMLAKEKLH